MELITAEKDGWEALRLVTFRRDKGCVATNPNIFGKDVAPDLCRDKDGWIIPATALHKMEFDHVREDAGGRRYDDEAHGVTACAWHHRLSTKWRTDTAIHRAVLRLYLSDRYPDVWPDLRARSSLT